MDLSGIARWTGQYGPFVAIIGLQWAIIWRLLNRFFQQQDLVMRTITLAERSTEVAEHTVKDQ